MKIKNNLLMIIMVIILVVIPILGAPIYDREDKIFFFRLNEGTGTSISSEVGGFTGTTSSINWISGKTGFGNATQSDATTDYISTDFTPSEAQFDEHSLEFRISTTDSTANGYIMGSATGGDPTKNGYSPQLISGDITILLTDGGVVLDNFDFGCGTMNDGEWHHIVYVKNSTHQWKLYQDGVLCPNVATGDIGGASTDAWMLTSRTAHTNTPSIDLDQVIWWNKTLSLSEIVDLNNSEFDAVGFSINLISPEDNNITQDLIINFTSSGDVLSSTLVNNTIYLYNLDGSINQTNVTTGLSGTFAIITSYLTLVDGIYLWNSQYCSDDGKCEVEDANYTLTIDTSRPIFYNFSDNSETLFYNGTANFNVNIYNTNGTVFLEFDGINYTATNLTSNNYNVSIEFLDDNSSIYDYVWHSWSDGYFNLSNSSSSREYIIYPIERVCFNTTHPEYPDKFLCSDPGNNSLNFLFNISYFRKNVFANNSNLWVIDYSGEENKTFNVTMHKYDEVVNFSINISGTGNPENVLFYGLNNSIIDRFFPGYLVENNIFVNLTYDYNGTNYISAGEINLTYGIPSSKTIYFWMDDNAKLSVMTFNLSAVGYGFSYYNNFNTTFDEDSLLTNTINEGSYITTQGTDLRNFTYDDFEDNSINTKKWTHGIANGADTDGDYSWTIDNTETSGYMKIEVDDFHEIATGTDTAVKSLENYFYSNYSLLNIWTTQAVIFNMSYSASGSVEASGGQLCSFYNAFEIGDVEYWRSHNIPCLNDPDSGTAGCEGFALTDENLIFTLERQSNNSWMVEISGIERNYGQYLFTSGGNDYNCGIKTTTYNYNTEIVSTAYSLHPHATCTDSSSSLENLFYIDDLDYNIVDQMYFNQHVSGNFQNNANGCKAIDSITYFHNFNNSLYYRNNGTFISESIYSASGNVASATITVEGWAPGVPVDTEEIFLYLSADEGENWESVSDGVEHAFSNTGTQIKWRADFNITDPGYKNSTSFLNNVNITVESGNPSNITFDFGDDGIIDYTIEGEFNETNGTITIDLSDADLTEEFLKDPTSPYPHLHSVPLVISSASLGQLNLGAFNLTYDSNPVRLNKDYIQTYLNNLSSTGFNNISFNVESINGTINLTDLRYDYLGGNYTINVTIYQEDDVSNNDTFIVNVFYSSFYKNFPYTWTDYIFFLPKTNSSKNITPYGQTSTTPIYNITTTNYGGNMNLSISVNKTFSCMNITWSTNSTKSTNIINTSWQNLSSNLEYLNNTKIWLWGDLNNCNASEMRILNPVLQIESYCATCLWGE